MTPTASRTVVAMMVCLCTPSGVTNAQVVPDGLTITLNTTAFAAGDTMTVTATLTPVAPPGAVDAYVVLQIPTGQYLSLQLTGALVPGVVPIARAFTPFSYKAELLRYAFNGAEPPGTYTWYSILTRPGTLELLTALHQVQFTVGTATPQGTRTQLSNALSSGNLESAADLLGPALADAATGLAPGDRQAVAQALNSCTVVESSAVMQICATADNEFRFVLLREETGGWRVVVW